MIVNYSILGLGDIILPGLLMSLALKYDIDCCVLKPNKPTNINEFKLPLYYCCLTAYTLSLFVTYIAMFLFKHAQPALVFIVPMMTIALCIDRCL